MFCTKCGFDCGSANFCQRCGNDLRQVLPKKHTTLTRYDDIPAVDPVQIPIGRYKTCDNDYLELGKDAVTLYTKIMFRKPTVWTITYDEIYDVQLKRAVKNRSAGFISIQDWNRRRRIIADVISAMKDPASIAFSYMEEAVFIRVYQFLKGCAEKNRERHEQQKTGFRLSQELLRQAQGKHPLDYYYQKFYPNRSDAIATLRLDTGLSAEQAAKAIDFVFDVFSEERNAKSESEMISSDSVICPMCSSQNISCNKKGFNYARGYWGAKVSPAMGLLLGGIGADNLHCVCMKCGYKWEIK